MGLLRTQHLTGEQNASHGESSGAELEMGSQQTGLAQVPESTVMCQRCILSAEALTRAGLANSGVQLGGSQRDLPLPAEHPRP